jgi:hypothetical protein
MPQYSSNKLLYVLNITNIVYHILYAHKVELAVVMQNATIIAEEKKMLVQDSFIPG